MNSRSILTLLESHLLYRRVMIFLAHVVLMIAAYLLAFLLRFEFSVPSRAWHLFLQTSPLLLLTRVAIFGWFHLYEGLWRYVSMRDIVTILKAGTLGSAIFLALILIFFRPDYPYSIVFIDGVLCLALVGGVRLAIRAVRESSLKRRYGEGKRALIVGAGDAGEMLMREIERNLALNYDVVGFVDDDPRKHGRRIHGIEVAGPTERLAELCWENGTEEILVAIPSATGEQRRRIMESCRATGVPFRTVPALVDLFSGRAGIGQLREVSPEELLGREAVRLDVDELQEGLKGKRIVVTGAGGSIGSELCRQIAVFSPASIVLFERAESSLYFVEQELLRTHPELEIVAVVGDILDEQRVEEVFDRYSPEIVYHAAAYKHVPLMEAHPLAAIQNNVFGTEVVAHAAQRAGVKKFVFISTDKAVKPVGIMGMTKRAAECLLLALDGGLTTFVAVRFGNVLGSDGSVLPLFQWQIANGGPVTVTDPEASRYFMLVSEAAQLVLQAGVMGRGGEVFFLDMGEPVRIGDLAENLIRLSGLEPGREISIQVTGLRPGERLQEELVRAEEDLLATGHEKVLMVRNHRFDRQAFLRDLEVLHRLVSARDIAGAVARLEVMTVSELAAQRPHT